MKHLFENVALLLAALAFWQGHGFACGAMLALALIAWMAS